jgi:glutamate dehydrogenase/leucine dehydrogenase
MVNNIFGLMEKEDFTTMEIYYNRKDDIFLMRALKEWDDDRQWDKYMIDFTYEDILTQDYKAVGTKTLRDIFKENGLAKYLADIEERLRKGQNHGIEFYYNKKINMRIMYCKHINLLGIQNRRHAIRNGATRRHDLEDPEMEVIIDGINISRAMAYKNAISEIPYGGSKILLQCAPVKADDLETLGFLAYVSDRSRSITGPDMNLSFEMAATIRNKFTVNYTDGRADKTLGTSGQITAYGEYTAMKEACDFVYGSKDIKNKKVAIQGLGAVGEPLAEYLLNAGAKLIVADIDVSKINKLQEKWGNEMVAYVAPDDIYDVDADIFSPCAMGAVITEERLPRFKFRIIMGSANNQLKATSKEEEIDLAKKIADAGILYVIDWAHNTGGCIKAWAEWVFQENASFEKIKPRVERICGTNIRKILGESKETGKTPTELIYDNTEKVIYSGIHFSENI